MCVIRKEKDKEFFSRETLGYFPFIQLHIELIEGPLHQGTLSHPLFLKLRCYMLSHMNELDPFIFRCVFMYEIQNCIFQVFIQQIGIRAVFNLMFV